MKCFVHFRTNPIRKLFFALLITAFPFLSYAQPNNLCSGAINLVSSTSCGSPTAGTTVGATYNAVVGACGASGGNRNDVWYTFTAKSTAPTITLSGALVSKSLQLFNGPTCLGTSVQCAVNSATLVASGLTLNAVYYIRVWSDANTAGTFSICVTDPVPANDLCAAATVLTTSIAPACVTTAGNVYGSTVTATTITAPDCAGAVTYDLWYKFVAETTNPTITLSSVGANFTGASMQLLSNNCGGTFTSYFCGSTVINADFLTPGLTYFIRVYSTNAAPTTGFNAGFNICIQDPDTPTPFNDNCANAINIPIWNTCNNIAGDMAGATASATPLAGGCNTPLAYDIWYKFTSLNATATITLSSIGANFLTPNLQIFSGTCAGLTSLACGVSPLPVAGLTAGNIYYVRVYSTTAPPPNGNARFNICATTTSAPIRFGNSYVNVTRKTTGGVVQNGDVLEIRMMMNHTSNTMYNLRFVDNVPTKTTMALTAPNDSIRIITNEGLTYKKYTLAGGDDAGTYKASPGAGEFNIRLNLAFGGTPPGIPANTTSTENVTSNASTMVAGSDKPRGGGGMLFAVAYRVVVTGVAGDTITIQPAKFLYRTAPAGTDITLTATSFKVVISNPLTLCSNSIGVNSAVESGGTFGVGTTLNRSTDLVTPIGNYTFIPDVSAYSGVGDGRYAIVKNLSPRNSTNRLARRQNTCNTPAALAPNDVNNCTNRMFSGFWYIDGDHSGTVNAIGNTPPAVGGSGGYMLMVNADYVPSEVYRQTVSSLCPNTYYEFSAWIRNICPNCALDSSGTSTYKPGVYPNLTFALNDVDYYNTGEVDTLGWLKKGFVFKTDTNQFSATFSIRNNSQGGGGNDWALDDIAVATCFPNMTYSPTSNPSVCMGNAITIADTVRSFFNNYVLYKWQKSTNGGGLWTDIPGTSGTGTPVWNGTAYQYISTYTIPPAQTAAGNAGDLYRLVVASTTGNLGSLTCSYTDPTTITLNVLTDCGPVLAMNFMSVNGRLNNGLASVNWITSKEDQPVYYIVEKSIDGVGFSPVATVNGYNNISAPTNDYTYNDPTAVSGKVYYRVIMVLNQSSRKYSRIVQLNTGGPNEFMFGSVVNPFSNELQYELHSPVSGMARVELVDGYGRLVRTETQRVYAGNNSLSMSNTASLPEATYILKVYINNNSIFRRVMKKNK